MLGAQTYPAPPSQGAASRSDIDEGSFFVGKLPLVTNLSSSIAMPDKNSTMAARDSPGRRSPFPDSLPQMMSGSPLQRGRSTSSARQQPSTMDAPMNTPQRCFSVATMHTVDFVDMFGEPCAPDVSSTIVFLVTPSQVAPYRLVSPSSPSRSLGASPPVIAPMTPPNSGISSRPYIVYRSWIELSALDDRLQSTFDMLLSAPRRNTLARLSAELSPTGKLRAKGLRVLKTAAFLNKSSTLPASRESQADVFRRKLDECWAELLLAGGEVIASSRAMQSFCHKRSTDDRMSTPAESLAPSDDPFKAPSPVQSDFLRPLKTQRGAFTAAEMHERLGQENIEPSSCFEEEILEPSSYRDIPRRRGSNMFDRFRQRATEQQDMDAVSDASSQSIRSSSSVRSFRSIKSFASSRLGLQRSTDSLQKMTPGTLRSPAEQVRASFIRPTASPNQTGRSVSNGHRPSVSVDVRPWTPQSESYRSPSRASDAALDGSLSRDSTFASADRSVSRASGRFMQRSNSRDSGVVLERPVLGASRASSSGASPSGSVFRCSSEADDSSSSVVAPALCSSVPTLSSSEAGAICSSKPYASVQDRARSQNISSPNTRSASPVAIPGSRPSANLSRYSSMRLGSWLAPSRLSASLDTSAHGSPCSRPTRMASLLTPTPGSSESSQDQPETPMPVATPTEATASIDASIRSSPSSLERMIFGAPAAAANDDGASFADLLSASPTRASHCSSTGAVHESQAAPAPLDLTDIRRPSLISLSLSSNTTQEDSSAQVRHDSPTVPCLGLPPRPDTFLDLPCSSTDTQYDETAVPYDRFGGSRASPRRHSGLAVRISLDFGDADSIMGEDSLDVDETALPEVHPYADAANMPFTPPRRTAHPYAAQ